MCGVGIKARVMKAGKTNTNQSKSEQGTSRTSTDGRYKDYVMDTRAENMSVHFIASMKNSTRPMDTVGLFTNRDDCSPINRVYRVLFVSVFSPALSCFYSVPLACCRCTRQRICLAWPECWTRFAWRPFAWSSASALACTVGGQAPTPSSGTPGCSSTCTSSCLTVLALSLR